MEKLFFNGLIRSLNISFVKTLVTFCVAYEIATKENNELHRSISIGVILCFGLLLAFLGGYLTHNRERLGTPEMDARIERLYVDIHLTREKTNILYHQIFFFKRYVYILIPLVIFPSPMQTFQI